MDYRSRFNVITVIVNPPFSLDPCLFLCQPHSAHLRKEWRERGVGGERRKGRRGRRERETNIVEDQNEEISRAESGEGGRRGRRSVKRSRGIRRVRGFDPKESESKDCKTGPNKNSTAQQDPAYRPTHRRDRRRVTYGQLEGGGRQCWLGHQVCDDSQRTHRCSGGKVLVIVLTSVTESE